MAYYNKNINALYIHIPKCYGTFISSEIMKLGFKRCHARNIMKKNKGTLQTVVNEKNIVIDDDTLIITFIRDPIERFISGCNYCEKDINSIFKSNLSLKEHWHILMPQIKHLEIDGKDILKRKNLFIGNCNEIELYWNKLMVLLTNRGLKNIVNIEWNNHKNVSKKINKTINDTTMINIKKVINEDIKMYNSLFK